jgi:hypothetical protein
LSLPTPPIFPRAAVRLGFLSIAPLLIAGLVGLSRDVNVARIAMQGFAIYAAVLLSFLGGIRCGFELMRAPQEPSALRLFFSALPALAGWALALLIVAIPGALGAASAFAGLFAAQYMWDQRSAGAGAPDWYPLLRQVLTGGVMIACLLAPLTDLLRRL